MSSRYCNQAEEQIVRPAENTQEEEVETASAIKQKSNLIFLDIVLDCILAKKAADKLTTKIKKRPEKI